MLSVTGTKVGISVGILLKFSNTAASALFESIRGIGGGIVRKCGAEDC